VSEVALALAEASPAGLAPDSRVDYSQARIHEAALDWVAVVVVGVGRVYARRRQFVYHLRREQAEFYAQYLLSDYHALSPKMSFGWMHIPCSSLSSSLNA